MAEVTRVPLQPLKKGSLAKLWLGVLLVIAAGAALAWLTVPKGVTVIELTAGTGANPTIEDVVVVNYTGKLQDGTVFDEGQAAPLPLSRMIPGFREGLLKTQKGGKYTLEIPSEKAYGSESNGPIPANSDLVFEIEVLDFMSESDFNYRMQLQQQMMQMQQSQGDVPAQ